MEGRKSVLVAQVCYSPILSYPLECPALTLETRSEPMGSKKQVFAQPFAEIWQYFPFHPSMPVAEFLQQFMRSGQFDAERFWAFVTESGPMPMPRVERRGLPGN